MNRVAVLLALSVLASCSPVAVSPSGYVSQAEVAKAKPVAPAASAVRGAAEAVDANANRVEVRADTISRETKTLREALSLATAEVKRMSMTQENTKVDMAQLWARLTEITTRANRLEDEAEAAMRDLTEQRELRRQAGIKIIELEQDAQAKDAQAAGLELQLADEKRSGKAHHELAVENAKAASGWKAQADSAAGKLSIFYAVAGIVGVVLLIYAGIRWGLPLLRRSTLGV